MSFSADGTPFPAGESGEPSGTRTLSQEQLDEYVQAQIRLMQATKGSVPNAGIVGPTQNSTSDEVTNSPVRQIASVAFKAPQPLYSQNPVVWFNILEQSFQLSHIRLEPTMYAHALAALDARHHDAFAELILRDKGNNPYTTFKNEVIRVLSESEKSKLNNILHGLTLGDQKPSQLLNKFRLNAGRVFDENALRQLWMKRLPSQVQMILTPFERDVSLNTLAERADNIVETMTQSSNHRIASVDAATNSTRINNDKESLTTKTRMDDRLDKLTLMISELCGAFQNSRSRSSSQSKNNNNNSNYRNRSRSASRSKINPKHDQCYYHFKFGTKAKKCVSGCKFFTESKGDSNQNF